MRGQVLKQVFTVFLICCSLPILGAQNLGRIDFPTSGSEAAQKHFIEGVLFLHNFEYEDAHEQFKKAEEIEPGFAMALWGQAMCANHPLWRQVDLEEGRGILQRLGATPEERLAKVPTEREKGYLRAVEALYGPGDKAERDRAYHEAMRRHHESYPKDLEAAAFYALSFLGLSDGTRDFRNYMRAGAVAEEVFAANPQHPGAAHYMIHSYDDPIHAPLGLRPARVYAQIAPAASHAQHMVSHIFVAMGMWDEASKANEISFEVADKRVQQKGLGIDDRNFHSLLWLHYSYLQQGRLEQARRVLEIMRSDTEKSGSARTRRHLALMRAAHAVETQQRDPIPPPVEGDELGENPGCSNLFASALVGQREGNHERVKESFREMEDCGQSDAAAIMRKQVEAMLALGDDDSKKALQLLEEATEIEDAMPYNFGPPVPAKPAHEMLGEVLMQEGRYQEAAAEFEKALERAPGRALSLLGLARSASRAGSTETAAESYRQLRQIWHAADSEWPGLLGMDSEKMEPEGDLKSQTPGR